MGDFCNCCLGRFNRDNHTIFKITATVLMIAVITTATSVKLLANSMRRSRRFFSSLFTGFISWMCPTWTHQLALADAHFVDSDLKKIYINCSGEVMPSASAILSISSASGSWMPFAMRDALFLVQPTADANSVIFLYLENIRPLKFSTVLTSLLLSILWTTIIYHHRTVMSTILWTISHIFFVKR